MPEDLSYDQKAMMAGLPHVRAKHFEAILMWKLFYRYMLIPRVEIDVFSAPIPEKPAKGEWRLVTVYKLSPWVLMELLNKLFPGRAEFDQKMFIDFWSDRDWAQPLYFAWVPDRTALSTEQAGYHWTLEECLADEAMFQFEKRLYGDLCLAFPSLLGNQPIVCQDSMFKDSSRPAVCRNSMSGDYHIRVHRPALLLAEAEVA